jgi:hypothetical protein
MNELTDNADRCALAKRMQRTLEIMIVIKSRRE